ncbi:MAG: nuclear transport factor 2 family protein [Hydrogenophaga sp.]|uniref:nuclear transport factor 2 family protein n=1 Tax=Hydrogenophaga sp. TaxID=1904254 RepID=UPI002633DCC0|nr:nuclear transport factor 2 family protein [Hydrogenophaga sp.]MCW5668978.1 nuclear transport factor 2 family protein [Hydrogenophaga sp.]
MPTDTRAAIDHLCDWFESLSPASLARLGEFYTADARFKDPFNEVQGLPAITRIFEHMFENLNEPRFVVTDRLVDGEQGFLVWEFHFRFRRFDTITPQVVRGGSHLRLASDGRVSEHRDYWDAAEELYEKLPLLGGLMRWLKKRAQK